MNTLTHTHTWTLYIHTSSLFIILLKFHTYIEILLALKISQHSAIMTVLIKIIVIKTSSERLVFECIECTYNLKFNHFITELWHIVTCKINIFFSKRDCVLQESSSPLVKKTLTLFLVYYGQSLQTDQVTLLNWFKGSVEERLRAGSHKPLVERQIIWCFPRLSNDGFFVFVCLFFDLSCPMWHNIFKQIKFTTPLCPSN